ncbi:hypothetical protein FRC01_012593, partial [Tulasnella sp. 417]
SKPSSSKAAQFPYDPALDQSRAAQQIPVNQKSANEKANPSDLVDDNPFDPPPEYTPTDAPKKAWSKAVLDEGITDADLDVLRCYDTIFIVDDSGSMLQDDSDSDRLPKGKSKQRERTRWDKARDALEAVAAMATQHDGNGVDIYFLNSGEWKKNCRNEGDVLELFNRVTPRGKTPTGYVLKGLIAPYIESLIPWSEKADQKPPPKPRNYI